MRMVFCVLFLLVVDIKVNYKIFVRSPEQLRCCFRIEIYIIRGRRKNETLEALGVASLRDNGGQQDEAFNAISLLDAAEETPAEKTVQPMLPALLPF